MRLGPPKSWVKGNAAKHPATLQKGMEFKFREVDSGSTFSIYGPGAARAAARVACGWHYYWLQHMIRNS